MSVTATPHITDLNPESAEIQSDLTKAGAILARLGFKKGDRLGFSAYLAHHHFEFEAGEVLVEETVSPGERVQYPEQEAKAITMGLPSCWTFEPDGTVVVLRYADRRTHAESDVDVMSAEFQRMLGEIGRAFAHAGLYRTVELNIDELLFPCGIGEIKLEDTDYDNRRQYVRLITPSPELRERQQAATACFSFSLSGEPIAMGWCSPGDCR